MFKMSFALLFRVSRLDPQRVKMKWLTLLLPYQFATSYYVLLLLPLILLLRVKSTQSIHPRRGSYVAGKAKPLIQLAELLWRCLPEVEYRGGGGGGRG